MRRWFVILKWLLGSKGRDCDQCGFYEATHYDHALEFDMESYPCDKFKQPGGE